MTHFVAWYEDAAKAEAAARAAGFSDAPGESWSDFVEVLDYKSSKKFDTLDDATQWLVAEINAMKTSFGCGTIYAIEPVKRRCRYCVCHGTQNVHEYTVEDTGIVDDVPCESLCTD